MADDAKDELLEATRKLLITWNVGVLYELFKEEDITINELKMMQYGHVYELLKHQKMGVKIRFEYHLNSWRNKIGVPFKTVDYIKCHHAVYCNCKTNPENFMEDHSELSNSIVTAKNSGSKRKFTQIVELNENRKATSPQSVSSNNTLDNKSALEFSCEKMQNTDDESENENLPFNTLTDISTHPAYKALNFPPKSPRETCKVTLQQILDAAGPRAMEIINFFRQKNRLTNIHRTILIQLIVDYFDAHDLHLTLNTSHFLEWEILKMFPTEKLESYRTEKRGKMYIKYSNMKRYKRDRNLKVQCEIESLSARAPDTSYTVPNEVANLLQKDCEDNKDWIAKANIAVKQENFSDNEMN